MKIVLRKMPESESRVEIVAIDGGTEKIPPSPSYESQDEAIRAAAQYLGIMSDEFDEVDIDG